MSTVGHPELVEAIKVAIDSAARDMHDARDWFDSYYVNGHGETVGDRLVAKLVEAAESYFLQ